MAVIQEYFQINDNGEVSTSTLSKGGKAVTRGKITEIILKKKRKKEAQLKHQKKQRKKSENWSKNIKGYQTTLLLELKKI